jgi:Flp pilus assembly protein TadG
MKRSKFLALPRGGLWRDRKGATAVFFASMIPGLVAVAGLTVDVGRTLAAKRALDSATQSAALAGAYALQSSGTASAASTAVSSWATANRPANVTVSSTVSSTSCNTATTGLPSCSGSSPNVVSVTQSGTVSTFFLGAFGRSSFTLTSTASAAKAGGAPQPLNVMFVLDATGSMSNGDSGCGTVPGISSPSRWNCALYSIQSVLKVMPTSAVNVGLMIFPGMGTQYSPTSHPCGTQPASVPYYTTNIKYQIGTALDNTYNDGSSSLVSTSPMVQYVGKYTTSGGTTISPCVTNKGGEGSFGAEAIARAQAALPTNDGRQNVIIFLSDGEYNSTKFASGYSAKATDQCKQAVTAAQAATAANVTVYSVAYGAATTNSGQNQSGCYKDTGYSPAYTPCTTMQAIASDSAKFYTTDTSCSLAGTANVTHLPAVFSAIAANLATITKPRLIAN